MKWNDWTVLIGVVCIMGLQVYQSFFKANPVNTVFQGRDTIIERHRDSTIVLKEREKVIEKHYEYEHKAINNLPDSTLLDNADSLATLLRHRKSEVTKH